MEEILPALQQAGAAQGIEVAVATEAIEGARRGFPARVIGFLRDVRAETRKVTWPSWLELRKATTAIVIFVIALGIAVGLMDSLFQFLLVTAVAKIF